MCTRLFLWLIIPFIALADNAQEIRTTVMNAKYSRYSKNLYLGKAYQREEKVRTDETDSYWWYAIVWGDLVYNRDKTINLMTLNEAKNYCAAAGAELPNYWDVYSLLQDLGYGSAAGYSPYLADQNLNPLTEDFLPNLNKSPFWTLQKLTVYSIQLKKNVEDRNSQVVFDGSQGLSKDMRNEKSGVRCVLHVR